MPQTKRKSTWTVTKTAKRRRDPMKKLKGYSISPVLKDSFKNTHVYFENLVTLNPSVSIAAVNVFSANGLYDPNVTGVGHQPVGFDEMTSLYGDYIVKRCWVKAVFVNSESAAGALVGIAFTQTGTSTGDVRQYIENGNCTYSVVGASTGKDCTTVLGQIDISKMAGFNVDNSPDYSGSSGANPALQIYAHVFAAGITGGDPGSVQASVELRYDVEWRRPRLASLS